MNLLQKIKYKRKLTNVYNDIIELQNTIDFNIHESLLDKDKFIKHNVEYFHMYIYKPNDSHFSKLKANTLRVYLKKIFDKNNINISVIIVHNEISLYEGKELVLESTLQRI